MFVEPLTEWIGTQRVPDGFTELPELFVSRPTTLLTHISAFRFSPERIGVGPSSRMGQMLDVPFDHRSQWNEFLR